MQLPPRAGNAGVDQFARQHAAVAGGQQQPDFVELRPLCFVHGHRKGAVVRRQRGGVERARGVGGVAREPGQYGAVSIAEANANVAVEQAVAVAVFGDEDQAAVEMATGGSGGALAEHGFDAGVEGTRALGAFAHGGEQAQARGQGEGFGGIAGVGKGAPMGQQAVAVGLQRVGEGFVEVDTGQVAAAQECEGGGGVAFADCGGEGG